jgi:hypothetical protein
VIEYPHRAMCFMRGRLSVYTQNDLVTTHSAPAPPRTPAAWNRSWTPQLSRNFRATFGLSRPYPQLSKKLSRKSLIRLPRPRRTHRPSRHLQSRVLVSPFLIRYLKVVRTVPREPCTVRYRTVITNQYTLYMSRCRVIDRVIDVNKVKKTITPNAIDLSIMAPCHDPGQ